MFCCVALSAQQSIAVLPPVGQIRGLLPDSAGEVAADLTYSPFWSHLDCCMLDCSSAGKPDDPVSLKKINAPSAQSTPAPQSTPLGKGTPAASRLGSGYAAA